MAKEIDLFFGITLNGTRFKKVIVDGMIGIDEEIMADEEYRDSFSRASTALLSRCILEVPGYNKLKARPEDRIPIDVIQEMYQCDKDMLLMGVFSQAENTLMKATLTCSCKKKYNFEQDVSELKLKECDPVEMLDIVLPRGFANETGTYKVGKLTLPKVKVVEEMDPWIQTNPAKAETVQFWRCLTHMDGDLVVTETRIRRLSSVDRRYIGRLLSEHTPGQDMVVKHKCSCGKELTGTWDLSGFFQ